MINVKEELKVAADNPEEYAKLTAIVIHAMIHKDVERHFPSMTTRERDGLKAQIIERVALMRGYSLRFNGGHGSLEDDG